MGRRLGNAFLLVSLLFWGVEYDRPSFLFFGENFLLLVYVEVVTKFLNPGILVSICNGWSIHKEVYISLIFWYNLTWALRSERSPHDTQDLRLDFAHVSYCKMDGEKHGNKVIHSVLVPTMAAHSVGMYPFKTAMFTIMWPEAKIARFQTERNPISWISTQWVPQFIPSTILV